MCFKYLLEIIVPKSPNPHSEEDEEIKRAAEILMTLKKPPNSESSYELRNRSVLKYSSVYPAIYR
jgi:hypothetical protein